MLLLLECSECFDSFDFVLSNLSFENFQYDYSDNHGSRCILKYWNKANLIGTANLTHFCQVFFSVTFAH